MTESQETSKPFSGITVVTISRTVTVGEASDARSMRIELPPEDSLAALALFFAWPAE